jgi:predicted pyridoxine 5'-phosphate oxidase superfamily flavin-nucleotide-binding protein
MGSRFAQITFTEKVQNHQEVQGSRRAYLRMAEGPESPDQLGPNERMFIGERDSFYLASVGESGWPYIQHRGGPRGFLKVVDGNTVGFADFRGNRQYITRGNVDHDNRVALFFMDYANQIRLKVLGRVRVVENNPELLKRLTPEGYPARVERAVLIDVEAFDWNCPQHIPQMFPRDAVEQALHKLHNRIEKLEAENAKLKAEAGSSEVEASPTR